MKTAGIITLLPVLALLGNTPATLPAQPVDLILHNGKIVTVDEPFSIHSAMSVRGERIVAVGAEAEILTQRGAGTKLVDLQGKTVLPGLMDSHVHPRAAFFEFDHEVPVMESIPDVLAYIQSRTAVVPDGDWIVLQQNFITRLKEQRYPTRAELDSVAPRHPVIFRTGPDAALNSLGLELAGIDREFRVPEGSPGRVERDADGEPNGILRGHSHYTRLNLSSGRGPNQTESDKLLLRLFQDYLSVGLTTVADRGANAGSVAQYQRLQENGGLPVRLMLSHTIPAVGPLEKITGAIEDLAQHPLREKDPRLRIIGTKIWLDGGMLTGSAYLLEPWGTSRIYGITDPDYRGVLNVPRERLLPMVEAVARAGMQFTAHSVGDGAVTALLDVYEEIDRATPIRDLRLCVTHTNFMTREAVEKAARLGVVMDIQPAWLYLDGRTLAQHFGNDRLRYFQPLRSLFESGGVAGGGSDHMQKIGSWRAINPYNPFLGMWITLTRQPRWSEGALHPAESLSREQAIRFYTINNAWLLFLEEEVGSLEPGKRADFIVLDRDILTCPVDEIKDIQVRQTWMDGQRVFVREAE